MLLAYFSIHTLLALDAAVLVEASHKRHVNMTQCPSARTVTIC